MTTIETDANTSKMQHVMIIAVIAMNVTRKFATATGVTRTPIGIGGILATIATRMITIATLSLCMPRRLPPTDRRHLSV